MLNEKHIKAVESNQTLMTTNQQLLSKINSYNERNESQRESIVQLKEELAKISSIPITTPQTPANLNAKEKQVIYILNAILTLYIGGTSHTISKHGKEQ